MTKLSYATAVSLFENDAVGSIINAFHLPERVDPGDIVQVIHAATGQDISMPAPDASGEVRLDRASMQNMKRTQLRLLHMRTAGCRGSTKRSKDKLIEDILGHHPDAQLGAREVGVRQATSAIRQSLMFREQGGVTFSGPLQ
jgi:hypothetical protein